MFVDARSRKPALPGRNDKSYVEKSSARLRRRTRARVARRSRGHHDRVALLVLISPSFLRPPGASLTAVSPGKSLLDFAAEPFMFPSAGSHHQIALEPFSCAGTSR